MTRLLIVDDSRTQAEALAYLARGMGLVCETALRPSAAIAMLQAKAFDAALIDVVMPEMSGYELCRHLRSQEATASLPLLLMTRLDNPAEVLEGLASGADTFLRKPFDGPNLLASLAEIRERKPAGPDGLIGVSCMGRAVAVPPDAPRILAYLTAAFENLALAGQREQQVRSQADDLRRAWRLMESCFDALDPAIGILDENGLLLSANRSWQSTSGSPVLGSAAPVGVDFAALVRRSTAANPGLLEFGRQLEELITGGRAQIQTELHILEGSREWFFKMNATLFAVGGVSRAVVVAKDVTALKNAERRLVHDAFHDSLTGLPNRALLHERLARALVRAERSPRVTCALLFVDLDGFKLVNDSLGHATGDAVLVEIADRLRQVTRNTDTAARLGGDEFTVLLEPAADHPTVMRIAARVQKVLAEPIDVDGQEIVITASMGVALGGDHYSRPAELLRDADIAMYRAKAQGRGRTELFDATMHRGLVARLRLESELRGALSRGELEVFYQPIVALEDARLSSFEALLRWRHPERGLVSPGEFIPVAEETGLIVPIGAWVLGQACDQLAAWRASGAVDDSVGINVNLSSRQFAHGELLTEVKDVLQRSGLDPRRLHLEVTETIILGHSERVRATMEELRALGIKLAMDDFGTGYSSLNYLRSFPFDILKIDRSFLGRLGLNEEDAQIIRTIIQLAGAMNLDVVAEGVETEEQRTALIDCGCTQAQGFLFARPAPASEFPSDLVRLDLAAPGVM